MNVGKIYKTVGIVDEVLGIFSISHPYIILYPLLDDCRLEAAFVACCRRGFFCHVCDVFRWHHLCPEVDVAAGDRSHPDSADISSISLAFHV